jgi:hypothetical protein
MKNSALTFRAPDAEAALCDPQIPSDEKHKIDVACLGAFFVGSATGPPKYEK